MLTTITLKTIAPVARAHIGPCLHLWSGRICKSTSVNSQFIVKSTSWTRSIVTPRKYSVLASSPAVSTLPRSMEIRLTYSTSSSSGTAEGSGTSPTAGVQAPDGLDEKEQHIFDKLTDSLQPSRLEVRDVSGGCGSMYAIEIASPKFKGLTMVKQHRMVNEILGEEISGWHGLQLRTKAE